MPSQGEPGPSGLTSADNCQKMVTPVRATWSVCFYFYCKIMLYGINYTYYSGKTVKICFHVPFRGVENRRSNGCLTLFTHRPRGVFETVVGVAKSPEGNA